MTNRPESAADPAAKTAAESEADQVRRRYARRTPADVRYSLLDATALLAMQERQRAILRLFAELGFADLAALDLLEVGSGHGGNLLEMLRLGFSPDRLAGIELLPNRHAEARARLPAGVALTLGDAARVPIAPASQDIVLQSTVFSSLLDDDFQRRLAEAMWAAAKPGGGVLWYDFTVNNPRNLDVRGVSLVRVRELFPGGTMQARRITLAPPIARAVTRFHPSLYTLFNSVPLLRTHVLAWIAKP